MPAKAVCQSLNLQLNHRYRRQASSHTGSALLTKSSPGIDTLWDVSQIASGSVSTLRKVSTNGLKLTRCHAAHSGVV